MRTSSAPSWGSRRSGSRSRTPSAPSPPRARPTWPSASLCACRSAGSWPRPTGWRPGCATSRRSPPAAN
eukprot:15328486-Heterocapsa_arctica.AAC.1